MKVTETIRILLVKRGNMSEAELGRRIGMTPQNFNRKMRNEFFSVADLEKISKALDCKLNISFTFNDTGETSSC
ncbi:MAG: helix-turn-helix transcriptional regulator [Oscillospiraceae bacterium]|nr:helix-turn-helix transcriptional regulator [Oscillospiraceae bacterium]